jgi:hypothetical protein
MKALVCLLAIAMLAGAPAVEAQQVLAASSSPASAGSALPPPGINAPGVKAKAPKARPKPKSVPLPSTGIPPSLAPAARQQEEANGQIPPQVAVTTNRNGDTVETYSRNGHVFMVQVTPKHGVTQTYMNNSPNGSLMHDPNLGQVAPVYYTLYKWGAGPKPASADSSAPAKARNRVPPPPSSSK